MNEDRRDLMAYNLWLVPSPFMFQQPTSFPPNPTQPAPIVFNNEHHAQPPMNNASQFPSFVNNLGGSLPNNIKQRKLKPHIRTISPIENGANPSRPFSEDRGPGNHVPTGNIKSENTGNENNSNQVSSPPVSAGYIHMERPEIAEMSRTMCTTCGKWFRSRQQLTQHMLVHTDVRKYQCNFCGRAFKQPSHLQQHHRIHTGEKPYRCPLAGCSRAFPQLSNLNHHLRNHDKPDPPSKNTCQFCDRTYASEAVLKNHVLKIHMCKTSSPSQTDLSNPSSETQSPVTENPADHLEIPENGTVLNSTDLAKLKDSGLMPIKCSTPQQLDPAYSPDSITRVPNNGTVKVENEPEDSIITDEIIKAYNTIAFEKYRQSMAHVNDRRELFDTMENGFRKAPMPVLNTTEIRQHSVQLETVTDKSDNHIGTSANLEDRIRPDRINEADLVSFNDKSAMLLEYWKDIKTAPAASTTVSQHPTVSEPAASTTVCQHPTVSEPAASTTVCQHPTVSEPVASTTVCQHPTVSELLRHKEYVSRFIEESNTKCLQQQRQDDTGPDDTVPVTNQAEIEQDSTSANESLTKSDIRSNYNYTLDFLEQDIKDLEKRAVSETAQNGSNEREYNEPNRRYITSPGLHIDMGRRSVIEEFVNQTGLAQARPFVQQMFNRIPHEAYGELNGIHDVHAVNNVTQDGARLSDYYIPTRAFEYARNAFNFEMGAIPTSLASREDPDCKDYSKCADEKHGRLSNSRKRKAFQPQRVVYDQEMTGF